MTEISYFINKLQENLYWRWTGIGKEEYAAQDWPGAHLRVTIASRPWNN